jgi:NAD(P)-dependent dehydrogenase (short-subunit alcohol dehydrogenase family)
LTSRQAGAYNNAIMRIVITGAAGMLGTDARRMFAAEGHQVLATDVGPAATGDIVSLDITDFPALRAVFQEFQPDLVFHGAAYTNVDGCERDPDLAFRVNAAGTWAVAAAAEEVGAALVAISTDFVFDGQKGERYTEFDTPNHLLAIRRPRQKLSLCDDRPREIQTGAAHCRRSNRNANVHGGFAASRHGYYRAALVRYLPCQQQWGMLLGGLRAGDFGENGAGFYPGAWYYFR